jgi:prevent-host-death family protein
MPQNLISLTLTDADHAAIADALSTLESKLTGLISLSTDERRSLNKMGEKSETFCRRTLVAMSDNAGLIPADVDVAEAQRDLAQLDAPVEGAGQGFWPGFPAQRHVRPLHAQGARHGKPGTSCLKPGPQASKPRSRGFFHGRGRTTRIPFLRVNCTEFCHPPKEPAMGFSASDVVPFTQARANLSELAEQAKAGAEKIITKNGESYVALIDAERLDYYHRLEREHIHLLLIDDARQGLADVLAGRTKDADTALAGLQAARKAKAAITSKAKPKHRG